MDLANHSETKEWMAYFKDKNCMSYAVNSHNKASIKEFLKFLQARVRDMNRTSHSSRATTVMLVGIPNVGKSALANSLHQIGRISAAEKGKLKHAIVTPQPGETKNIVGFKIASNPNIYVLDTPGILPAEILDAELCSKLALTGAIADILTDVSDLARYFLSTLNLNDAYKQSANFSTMRNHLASSFNTPLSESEVEKRPDKLNQIDHTQDSIVQAVRRALYEEVSAFDGNLENEKVLVKLIEAQLTSLLKIFQVTTESCEDANSIVASKVINLYRTGRLGHYTLDSIPGSA